MPECLPLIDMGQMDLDEGDIHRRQPIGQRNTGVWISTSIDNDEIRTILACCVNAIQQRTFMVTLKMTALRSMFRSDTFKMCIDVGQCLMPVDVGLSGTKQIKIGTMQHKDMSRHRGTHRRKTALFTPKSRLCPLIFT